MRSYSILFAVVILASAFFAAADDSFSFEVPAGAVAVDDLASAASGAAEMMIQEEGPLDDALAAASGLDGDEQEEETAPAEEDEAVEQQEEETPAPAEEEETPAPAEEEETPAPAEEEETAAPAEEEEESADDEDEEADEAEPSAEDADLQARLAEHEEKVKAASVRLERAIVSIYGVPNGPLQEFATELATIKDRLRESYTTMKQARDELSRKFSRATAKLATVKEQIRELSARIRRLQRQAEKEAQERLKRLKKQLRERIRAHRAGMDFVRKLQKEVDGLREDYDENFGNKVGQIQNLLETYADDMATWTGEDVISLVDENRQIGVDTKKNRLYTKKHLTNIVDRMFSKLQAAYLGAKEALRRATERVPNPHITRLEMLLNGLKSREGKLEIEASKYGHELNKIENGHPSLRRIREEFTKVKDIEAQIYTEKRVVVPPVTPKPKAAPQCVTKVQKQHKKFNQCREKLQKAVQGNAPKTHTYVLWKQFVVAKNNLRAGVKGCAREMQEEDLEF